MKRVKFAILACLLVFTHGFSQDAAKAATIPITVNIDATVSIIPSDCSTDNVGVQSTAVTASSGATLTISTTGTTPILRQTPALTGTGATYQLFSLSGKNMDISRQNIPQGIYLLTIKENSKTYTVKVTHIGGKFNLLTNVLRKNGVCTWTLTAKATGWEDVSYDFSPVAGTNPAQNITFVRPSSPQAMSNKTALQYFTDEGVKIGWNMGNTLDAVNNARTLSGETLWGNPKATQALFNGVKESGFDIVRIPVSWIGHIGAAPDYTLDQEWLKRVAEVVSYAKTAGLKAVINIHHDGNYTEPTKGTWGFLKFAESKSNTSQNTQIKEELGKVWTQIANYFKNHGDYLIFETLNEVHSGDWGFGMNAADQDRIFDWNQTALNAIRATGGNNATRFVAIPSLGATEPPIVISAHDRGKLLPSDGNNGTKRLIVAVHFYNPSQYTTADATPSQAEGGLKHTLTSAEIAAIDTEAADLKETFFDKGIAVYYGEWGAPTDRRSSMSTEIKNTHIDYIKRVAKAARANGIVPIYWDAGDFKMLERSNGKPKTGLWKDVLDAMMSGISTATLPVSPTFTGNLGSYRYGFNEDGVTTDYTQAVWQLSAENITKAKLSGAKLALRFSKENVFEGIATLVWQDPAKELWWNDKDFSLVSYTIDSDRKGIKIALSSVADYSSFTSATELNLIITYYNGSSVDDLGIVGANLE